MGASALSDLELLAILLGSGTRESDVLTLAGQILKLLDAEKEIPSVGKLSGVFGIGPAKASLIVAALEFAHRRIRPEGLRITFPADALPLVTHCADRKQEHFLCISVNGANEVIATRVVSVGLANKSQVHPREVFADPITDRAAGIIVAHNHPSADLSPSKEDIEVTRRLKAAGAIIGVRLQDHIIFNRKGYHSFLEHGEL
ncbi:MAG: DNA repair protein RadC [Armatimonadetes bacterium]|nr:DNA repair protein RadC [Armatimonadota bacterium]